ncbi:aconitate hydratase, cytoplasmic [Tanacetum coccineum]
MGRRGEQYPIFKLNGVKNFGAGSKELGFGENYTSLTRHLGDSIYSLNFLEFTQAVETLIDDMSVNADDLDGLTTYKWRRRMFTVVTAVAEAARSKVVSLSYDQSRERRAPTSTSWMWIKLLFNNWEKISKAAIGFDENIGLCDLTKEEKDMLFARNMPHTAKDLKKNLKAVLARATSVSSPCRHRLPLPHFWKSMTTRRRQNMDTEVADAKEKE